MNRPGEAVGSYGLCCLLHGLSLAFRAECVARFDELAPPDAHAASSPAPVGTNTGVAAERRHPAAALRASSLSRGHAVSYEQQQPAVSSQQRQSAASSGSQQPAVAASGSQRQAASGKRQAASSQRQAASSQRQAASGKRPAASSKQQAASSQQQAASSQQPAVQVSSTSSHAAPGRR